MEAKDGERVVISKPVASKPSCSSFSSFTELLTGAITASPPSETAIAAVRPKTVRFKPTLNRALAGPVSSQPGVSGTADKVLQSDGKSTVVYKPLAKLVSKTSVSLLANMGNFDNSHQQTLPSSDARVQHPKIPNNNNYYLRSHSSLNVNQNIPSEMETDQTIMPLKMPPQNLEEEPKSLPPMSSADRLSYDGYNWRKYGQKQVKGSEYPRSYYKCTHPNCPVKKKVERTLDGQIAEIVYKGEHNHSKPEPPKRNSLVIQDTNNAVFDNRHNERNEDSDGRVENQGKYMLPDSVATGAVIAGGGTPTNSYVPNRECEEGIKGQEGEDDAPRSKRRRGINQSNEVGISGEVVQEPRIVVQNSTDSEILGDGFRWRKYGQKVVKGNPYPRSYYRCTSLKCNVRKHVERASDDPKAFITTYEGKHNHEMPLRNAPNQVLSE